MSRKTTILLILGIIAAAAVQISILPVFVRPSFKPDLLLIVMVLLALRGPFVTGALLSWLLGMFEDVFGGVYLGLSATSFLFTFIVIKSVSDRLYADSSLLFILTVASATAAGFALNLLFMVLFTATPGVAYSMLSDMIPRLLVNAFAASVISLFPGFERKAEAS
ncbi:MAG: rod shape-determining protein MreD [Desulfuromonadales bacterium]